MTDKFSPTCVVCGETARSWSGAWLIAGAWIGWCSSEHKNAWLKRPMKDEA
jgi:hypothetical protein